MSGNAAGASWVAKAELKLGKIQTETLADNGSRRIAERLAD